MQHSGGTVIHHCVGSPEMDMCDVFVWLSDHDFTLRGKSRES